MSERSGENWSGEIFGNCPVQGYGQLDGKPWYFRARHRAWSFEIADDPLCPDVACSIEAGEPGVDFYEDYADGDAGWMSDAVAWRLIEEAMKRYEQGGGSARVADGIRQFVRCIEFFPEALPGWLQRWSEAGADPLQAAWDACERGSGMQWLLEVLSEASGAALHPRCDRCPPFRTEWGNQEVERRFAEHLRQAIPRMPPWQWVVQLKREAGRSP